MSQFFMNGLIAGSVYGILGLSIAIGYIPTRFFSFGHGAVFAWGAYSAYVATICGLPLVGAVAVAILAAAVLGAAQEVAIYKPLRRRGASVLVLLLASLGLYTILQNALSLAFGEATKSLPSGDVAVGIAVIGARITPVQIATLIVSVGMFILGGFLLRHTRIGQMYRCVASDPELARVQGIDVDRLVLWAFTCGSGLAGVAAFLVALDVDMTPAMGMNALMMGIVTMIIGGTRGVLGILMGGLLLGLAQHIGVWWVGTQWQDAIAFGVLFVFLVVRPHGIAGMPQRRTHV